MKKKQILISYNYILHYRKDFFELLSKYYDLTIIHSGNTSRNNPSNCRIIYTPVYKAGPFFLQFGLLKEYMKNDYDAVILLFDLRWINIILFSILSKTLSFNTKVVSWGSWLTHKRFVDNIRLKLMRLMDANILYCKKFKNDFISCRLEKDKLYVANNTIHVPTSMHIDKTSFKDLILVVGSLNSRKKNYELIKVFSSTLNYIPSNIKLCFVGKGPEFTKLTNYVCTQNLIHRVQFVGVINDNFTLKKYYNRALFSISYGQAGLSILQSLGFGVPFVANINALSGGEITNIVNGYNGFTVDDSCSAFKDIIIKLSNDRELCSLTGLNALSYYKQNCTIQNMVNGFIDAIENND